MKHTYKSLYRKYKHWSWCEFNNLLERYFKMFGNTMLYSILVEVDKRICRNEKYSC